MTLSLFRTNSSNNKVIWFQFFAERKTQNSKQHNQSECNPFTLTQRISTNLIKVTHESDFSMFSFFFYGTLSLVC